MTSIILQARLDSARLAKKALLPLDGKPLITRVMEALNHVKADLRILACPEDSFATFAPLAKECNFEIVAGPKEDVLERYCKVIRKYSVERVIRATGDNPFVFADAANALNEDDLALNADYACYAELPYGSGVESVRASALLQASANGATTFEREHVCPYLYSRPEVFKLYRPAAPEKWRYPQIRLTVDTREDYEKAVELYALLKDKPNRYHGITIIELIKKVRGLG